ncbi:hypothetical protein GA0061102_101596 [Rhizobium miluonense]|uniref:Uncharacterized protein n=1 Tax=Rhizobium miluonense TaxID=411945 RepID=A0A1C3VNA3_9HYPH|nr:hypothetical protein GA0061102_101596 [Rhizobium miluonense]
MPDHFGTDGNIVLNDFPPNPLEFYTYLIAQFILRLSTFPNAVFRYIAHYSLIQGELSANGTQEQ